MPTEREGKRGEYAGAVVSGEAERYLPWLKELRYDNPPLVAIHWKIEFPEVFERENPGFDAIIGNPPFMGGSKILSSLGYPFVNWLMEQHEGAHGNGDLVAHFFRRSFGLLRDCGAFGLIATNTIGQGDTRTTGLRWICEQGGTIFSARRRNEVGHY
jgi:hypothetical protein